MTHEWRDDEPDENRPGGAWIVVGIAAIIFWVAVIYFVLKVTGVALVRNS